MWPDRVSNPGRLSYESGALPTALRGPAVTKEQSVLGFLCLLINLRLAQYDTVHAYFFRKVARPYITIPTNKMKSFVVSDYLVPSMMNIY